MAAMETIKKTRIPVAIFLVTMATRLTQPGMQLLVVLSTAKKYIDRSMKYTMHNIAPKNSQNIQIGVRLRICFFFLKSFSFKGADR